MKESGAVPRSKKVIYVITKANWGGAQHYVFDVATEAEKRGYDVALVYGDAGILAERLDDRNIRTIQIKGLTRDVHFFQELSSFFQLLKLYKKERPDMVHVNSSKAGLGLLAARMAHVPLILFTAHGWAFNEARPWWQKILIYLLSWVTILLSHKTFCVSDAVRRDTRFMFFARDKCVVIHNGVSEDRPLSRDDARAALAPPIVARYWIGMISELHPTKRVSDAIDGFAAIAARHPGAALLVMGGGEEMHDLHQKIRDLEMEQRIILLGPIQDASRYLRAFDLFIHTSQSEALALAILEAGLAGLPVIATCVGGIPEIIKDGENGLLIPPKNPSALSSAIESLIENPERAKTFAEKLRERVIRLFTKERMLSETFRYYL